MKDISVAYDNGVDQEFLNRLLNHEHLKVHPVTFEPVELNPEILAISAKYPIKPTFSEDKNA